MNLEPVPASPVTPRSTARTQPGLREVAAIGFEQTLSRADRRAARPEPRELSPSQAARADRRTSTRETAADRQRDELQSVDETDEPVAEEQAESKPAEDQVDHEKSDKEVTDAASDAAVHVEAPAPAPAPGAGQPAPVPVNPQGEGEQAEGQAAVSAVTPQSGNTANATGGQGQLNAAGREVGANPTAPTLPAGGSPASGQTALNASAATAGPGAAPTAGANHAAASTSPSAPSFAQALSAQDADNVGRVTRGVSAVLQQQGGSVTLRLSPPEMGLVRIEMQISDSTVRAQLLTQQPEARSLLSQQLHQLRASLEMHGYRIERLDVQQLNPSSSHGAGQEQSTGHNAADGRSRGSFAHQPTSTFHAPDGGSGDLDEQPRTFEQSLNALA